MTNRIKFNVKEPGEKISKYIYGHFAEHLGRCIYDGIWVGKGSKIPNINGMRTDVIKALKNINVPVLRWPGGCFADEYHWMDGVGSVKNRRKSINTHWGMVTETHDFGTHEFFKLCELIGCDAYVAGNLGSGTVKEMQDWVDYISCVSGSTMSELRKDNGRKEPWKLPFFGIGNENWCCGGNMRPEYYADLYRQYQTYIKNYPGNKIKKIACGPNSDDYEWTDKVMKEASRFMWGFSMHYYTTVNNSFDNMDRSDMFNEEEWYKVIKNTYRMDELIKGHSAIMDKYDPNKKVALVIDEWGTWYEAIAGTNKKFLHQQNTIRDAVSASINFNIFHSHCGRVKMTNLAQTVNVLQSVLLTYDDILIKTPTYHVFDLYKEHQGNIHIPVTQQRKMYGEVPQISSTASLNKATGAIYFSVSNADHKNNADMIIEIEGIGIINSADSRLLTAPEITSYNSVENPDHVHIVEFKSLKVKDNEIKFTLPPRSVMTITIQS